MSLRSIFKEEVEHVGTRFHNIVTGGDVENARCVLVAATGPNYDFAKSWAENRRREDVPFVHVEVSDIRNGELNANWARLPALIAAKRAFPLAELLVYTDIDTLIDWPLVCKFASKSAMTISYKMVPACIARPDNKFCLRSNWFIIRTAHKETSHLLYAWYYTGRHVQLQDQTVLNELYRKKRWVEASITALKVGNWPHKIIELKHCGSWLAGNTRIRCLSGLQLDKFDQVA